MNKRKIVELGFSLIALALMSGCHTDGGTRKEAGGAASTAGADSIEARAKQRWAYLIEKKAEKAYDYLSPGYRKSVAREQYADLMNNRAVKWSRATVSKKECDAEVCEVFVSLDYEVMLPGGGGQPIQAVAPTREKWVKVGQQWYFLPKK